ncbi:MAG: nuclear transport factor 2 family protein [Pseudomonadota bacterium]
MAQTDSRPPATKGDGVLIATEYLTAMEARDFALAKTFLDPAVEMIFPGPVVFRELEAIAEWAGARYRRVGKAFERVDSFAADDGEVVVIQGTLHGEWLDGTPFEGIRFVDWFLIRNRRIVSQRVFNDLAEVAKAR